jgi:hypothetical protein
MTLTAERLRAVFAYSPTAGTLTRLVSNGRRWKVGSVAGTTHPLGYRLVTVDGITYPAHRLAWLHAYGEWPPDGMDIDHVNGDRSDNRLRNLRVATRTQNNANARRRVDDASGFKGVYLCRASGKWIASIRKAGKLTYLGRYQTPEEAHAAYLGAASRVFGEFARAA